MAMALTSFSALRLMSPKLLSTELVTLASTVLFSKLIATLPATPTPVDCLTLSAVGAVLPLPSSAGSGDAGASLPVIAAAAANAKKSTSLSALI